MNITEFLSNLKREDIGLWLEDGNLKYSAPEGGLPDKTKTKIIERKSEIIEFLKSIEKSDSTIEIKSSENDEKLLSFSQLRLWLFDQLEPENHAYNIPASVRLEGDLDIDALETGINKVVERHDILRTKYSSVDGNAIQIIAPELKIEMPRIDLRGFSENDKKKECKKYLEKEALTPFKLDEGPLIRATILILNDKEFGLLLTMHHIISDDWSLNIFVSELGEFYEAARDKRASNLKAMDIQYSDYANWQRDWLDNGGAKSQIEYWKTKLEDADNFIGFPTDKPRTEDPSYSSLRKQIMLANDTTAKLKDIARREGTTLYVTLLSAFKVLLSQYMGSDDVIIGSPVAGRTRKELETLIGYFNNTVVLRTDLSGNPKFNELIQRTKKVSGEAFANQDIPFERVVDEVLTVRETGKTPLFQVLFNMLNSTTDLSMPGLKVSPFEDFIIGAPNLGAKLDLTLLAIEHKQGLQLDFSFSADLFKDETVEWLLEHFKLILNTVSDNPLLELNVLPKLKPRSSKHVEVKTPFETFNVDETDQAISKRFESIAESRAELMAVTDSENSITYDKLNRESNRLANHINNNYSDGYKLNKREKIRYTRQLLLENWGMEKQEHLKSLTVFAAGAGGSGSPTIMQLALLGVGTIIVCDFDKLDLSNLNRQVLHDESRIGMNKAESAEMTIKRINPNVNVIAVKEKLTKENAMDIIGDSAIIFDNLDNIESKFVLSECAVKLGIPHVISSMIERSHYAAVFHTPHTPCFHCLYDIEKAKVVHEMRKIDNGEYKVDNPVSSPALFASTGFAVNEALKILLDLDNPAYNKYFLFNQHAANSFSKCKGYQVVTYPFSDFFRNICKEQGFDWDGEWNGNYVEELNVRKNPECPLCSKIDKNAKKAKVENSVSAFNSDLNEKYNNSNTQTVALLLGHKISMVKGILATLKAGKTFVTLDPEYPLERLFYMLNDTSARVIVTENEFYDLAVKVRDSVNRNVKVLKVEEVPTTLSDKNLNLEIDSHSLAYIMYTSGSTGLPKGVMQKQRNVLHYIMNYSNSLHINRDDRLSLIPSFSFSAAMMDTFAALLNGASLHLYNIKSSGLENLADWLISEKISVYHSVPTIFRHFTDNISKKQKFTDLRIIDLGGEPVVASDLELFKTHFEDETILVNGLGATELNVIRHYHMDKNSKLPSSVVPIGYEVEGTEILLLDSEGNDVGYNRNGEIVIKSKYLSPGYWEIENVKAFSYDQDSEYIMYHTGDLGIRRSDGCMEHLGRIDNQLKIHGIRIEAGEIENALDTIDYIKESAVIGKIISGHEKELVAFIVLNETISNYVEDIRLKLEEKLPAYMIPVTFVELESLPLTITGKVNRKSLSEYDLASSGKSNSRSEEYVEPTTEKETILCNIWQEILEIEKIGITDNMFQLGCNSLTVLRFVAKAKESGYSFSAAKIFSNPTVKQMAQNIEELVVNSKPKEQIVGEVLLNSAQELFLEKYNVNPNWTSPAQLQQISFELDLDALKKAMDIIIDNHDIFRSKFVKENGTWKQYLVETEDLINPISYDEIRGLSGDEEVEWFKKSVIAAQMELDLEKPPLMKLWVFKRGDDRGYLLNFQIHHLLIDGFSMEIFKDEFMDLYQTIARGEEPKIKESSLAAHEWAGVLSDYVNETDMEEEIKYWEALPIENQPEFPIDFKSKLSENHISSSDWVRNVYSKEETKELITIDDDSNISFYDKLISALAVTISEYSKNDWVLIETIDSGRNLGIDFNADLSRTIGWLNTKDNMLLNVDSSKKGNELADITSQKNNLPKKDIKLLKYHNDPEKRAFLDKIPKQIQVSLNFSGFIDSKDFDPIWNDAAMTEIYESTTWIHPDNERPYILGFVISVRNGELTLICDYSKKLHKKETVVSLIDNLINNLKSI